MSVCQKCLNGSYQCTCKEGPYSALLKNTYAEQGKQNKSISIHIPIIEYKATGIKHDQDKPDMSLLSNTALIKIAQVMTYGKKKYSAHNWRGGFIWSRPLAAAARHLFAYIGGEDKDPETGLSHLAHAACCLMFLLEFEDTHKHLDDRFKRADNK